ncbi:MAG: hypothetical protein L0Y44_02845 [Phycisphaerales bacterium]|nr:hypothetical protein [Phycisphaerales bacterium]MCI0629575.1 hypothetical protein [Phycisphaerales bacterium]
MNNVDRLGKLLAEHNRKIMLDSATSLAVGLITCVLIFGGVFWLSWLAFTLWLHGIRIGSAATSALIVTGLFALVSIWSAWRRHDPLANLEAMDPVLQDLQLGAGYALGVPVVNRQSVAGFAALLIGGPANLLDAWSVWRGRLRASSTLLTEASLMLQQSQAGVSLQMTKNPQLVVVLHRLGLVKAVRENEKVILRTTSKGDEVLAKGTRSSLQPPRDMAHRTQRSR